MNVNAEHVLAVYKMLLSFPPFSRWHLPDKVNTAVVPFKSFRADYDPKTHTIRVSFEKITTFHCLVEAVAHEMCHIRQDRMNRWPVGDVHNADFQRMAKQVCKHFPFDPANF